MSEWANITSKVSGIVQYEYFPVGQLPSYRLRSEVSVWGNNDYRKWRQLV